MKKISLALLVSLSAIASAAFAQTAERGITMTHDANVAAQIEQHARDVKAQPPVAEEYAQEAPVKTVKKARHHGKKTVAKSMKKAHATVASK